MKLYNLKLFFFWACKSNFKKSRLRANLQVQLQSRSTRQLSPKSQKQKCLLTRHRALIEHSFKGLFCAAVKVIEQNIKLFLRVPAPKFAIFALSPSRIADSIKADGGGMERVAMFPRFNIEGCKLMACFVCATHSLSLATS